MVNRMMMIMMMMSGDVERRDVADSIGRVLMAEDLQTRNLMYVRTTTTTSSSSTTPTILLLPLLLLLLLLLTTTITTTTNYYSYYYDLDTASRINPVKLHLNMNGAGYYRSSPCPLKIWLPLGGRRAV